MGKKETAHHEQFLLFPQCLRKTCTADTKKHGLFGINPLPHMPILSSSHSAANKDMMS